MNEIKSGENLESRGMKELSFQKIKPENGMTEYKAKSFWDKVFQLKHEKGYTTLEERIKETPAENCDYGEWTGERGQSKFIPNDPDVKDELAKFGKDGVKYKDGKPNFGPFSLVSVVIEMTENRYSKYVDGERIVGNFEKAFTAIAEQWNKSCKEGKSDWDKNSVEQWAKANGYVLHECSDMKTCQLIPEKIHKACLHPGGVMECKRRDSNKIDGGGFDE